MWIQAAELRPSLRWESVTTLRPCEDEQPVTADKLPTKTDVTAAVLPPALAATPTPTPAHPLAPLLALVDANPLTILGAKVPLAAAEYGLKVEGMAVLENGAGMLFVIKAWAFPVSRGRHRYHPLLPLLTRSLPLADARSLTPRPSTSRPSCAPSTPAGPSPTSA